jgi:hypothetical protein
MMMIGLKHESSLLVLVYIFVVLELWCSSISTATTLFFANIMTVRTSLCFQLKVINRLLSDTGVIEGIDRIMAMVYHVNIATQFC